MAGIKFQIIKPEDNGNIALIADWYLHEWNIPRQTTIQKLKELSVENAEFQVLLMLDGLPVATGGIYNHVGLLDRAPKFKISGTGWPWCTQ
jgi:hypothetical protein